MTLILPPLYLISIVLYSVVSQPSPLCTKSPSQRPIGKIMSQQSALNDEKQWGSTDTKASWQGPFIQQIHYFGAVAVSNIMAGSEPPMAPFSQSEALESITSLLFLVLRHEHCITVVIYHLKWVVN